MKPFDRIRHLARCHPTMGMPDPKEGGYFEVGKLRIIASWGDDWDHVSVSLPDRCPTWEEMDKVKRAFFDRDELVMQIHPAEADHISMHPYCLHLWRPHRCSIPLPPKIMVGF